MQLLICYGYKLKQALKFRRNGYENREASKHYSMSFWIYILKELFLKKEKNPTANLLNLISIIKGNLFEGGKESRKLSRTARLLIGIEKRDHDILSKLSNQENTERSITDNNYIQDYEEKEDEFYPYVHHIADQIFEASSIHHESGTFISPLAHALYNHDIKMVNILRSHPAFCSLSLSLKSRDLKGLFLHESAVHSLDWKNIYCTFFYILLKRDVNFFDNTDLQDFLSCRFRGFGMSGFVRFAKQFLASESGSPIQNTVLLSFRRTAICTQTMLIR